MRTMIGWSVLLTFLGFAVLLAGILYLLRQMMVLSDRMERRTSPSSLRVTSGGSIYNPMLAQPVHK